MTDPNLEQAEETTPWMMPLKSKFNISFWYKKWGDHEIALTECKAATEAEGTESSPGRGPRESLEEFDFQKTSNRSRRAAGAQSQRQRNPKLESDDSQPQERQRYPQKPYWYGSRVGEADEVRELAEGGREAELGVDPRDQGAVTNPVWAGQGPGEDDDGEWLRVEDQGPHGWAEDG